MVNKLIGINKSLLKEVLGIGLVLMGQCVLADDVDTLVRDVPDALMTLQQLNQSCARWLSADALLKAQSSCEAAAKLAQSFDGKVAATGKVLLPEQDKTKKIAQALSFELFANFYVKNDFPEKAFPYLLKSVAIDQSLALVNIHVIEKIEHLARLYWRLGVPEQVELSYQAALDLTNRLSGDIAIRKKIEVLDLLGWFYWVTRQQAKALQTYTQVRDLIKSNPSLLSSTRLSEIRDRLVMLGLN